MFGSETASTTNTWQVCDHIALRVYIVLSFKHGRNQDFVQVGGRKRGGGLEILLTCLRFKSFNNNGFKYRTRVWSLYLIFVTL